jgi:hypothetical protein
VSEERWIIIFTLGQGWAIVFARGPFCGSGGWRRAAHFKMIAFISKLCISEKV